MVEDMRGFIPEFFNFVPVAGLRGCSGHKLIFLHINRERRKILYLIPPPSHANMSHGGLEVPR